MIRYRHGVTVRCSQKGCECVASTEAVFGSTGSGYHPKLLHIAAPPGWKSWRLVPGALRNTEPDAMMFCPDHAIEPRTRVLEQDPEEAET